MAMLKINPAKLPDRGRPTRDLKPIFVPPNDAVVVRIDTRRAIVRERRPANRKNMWTAEQDKTAWEMYEAGKSYEEIAEYIGRSVGATKLHIHMMRKAKGVKPTYKKTSGIPPWTKEQDEMLIQMHNSGINPQVSAKTLGRSYHAVKCRVTYLRQKGYKLMNLKTGRMDKKCV